MTMYPELIMGNNGLEVIATEPIRQVLMQQSRTLRAPVVVRAILLLSLACPGLVQASAAQEPLGYDRTQSLTTLDILDCQPRSVYLTGFDFFTSGVHNVNEKWKPGDPTDPIGHRPEMELAWLAANLENYPLSVDGKLAVLIRAHRAAA